MVRRAVYLTVLIGLLGTQPALASSHGGSSEARERLSITALVERLAAAGYPEIIEIESERGKYEVETRTADGMRVELYVDAYSGEILKKETYGGGSRSHDHE